MFWCTKCKLLIVVIGDIILEGWNPKSLLFPDAHSFKKLEMKYIAKSHKKN